MNIEIQKFGQVLVSRQSGKEAYDAFLPNLNSIPPSEAVIIDFTNVQVFSPSWADEFLTPLLKRFGNRLKLNKTQNPSVNLTIETLEAILKQQFSLAE